MELLEIRPNALVEHTERGVGRIISVEGSRVLLRFDSDLTETVTVSMSTATTDSYRALPADGLESTFLHSPDDVLSWASTAPLRLIGATLTDLKDRQGKPGELQRRLDGRIVRDVQWSTWWQKWARLAVKKSVYFKMEGPNDPIQLLVAMADITDEPPPRAVPRSTRVKQSVSGGRTNFRSGDERNLTDWIQWLWSEEYSSLPGTVPPEGLATLLESCPEEILGRVFDRLLAGAEEVLETPGLSPRARDQWLEAIIKAQRRRRNCLQLARNEGAGRRMPGVLSQLLSTIQHRTTIQYLVDETVSLVKADAGWRREFATGLRDRYGGDPASVEHLLGMLANRLDEVQQAALWGDFLAAALAVDGGRTFSVAELDNVLAWLKTGMQPLAIRQAILRAAEGETSSAELNSFLVNSRYSGRTSNPSVTFALFLTACLLLDESANGLSDQVAEIYGNAVGQIESEISNPVMAALIRMARDRVEEREGQLQEDLAAQKMEFEALLGKKEQEQERLSAQVRTLRAELVSKREDSHLEIRQAMLLRIGDIIQRTYQPEADTAQVAELLTLALRDGRAEPLGVSGQTVPFNPRYHHHRDQIATGNLVHLVAPGVVVRGGSFGEKVILKASVEPEREEG